MRAEALLFLAAIVSGAALALTARPPAERDRIVSAIICGMSGASDCKPGAQP